MNENFSPDAAKAWLPFLREQALTETEFWLLDETYMTIAMPPARLVNWCLKENDGSIDEPRSAVEQALRSLIDRGLLLEIDEQVLGAIRLLLDRSRIVPADWLPTIGSVDLSLRGAAVMKRWRELVFGHVPSGVATRTVRGGPQEVVFATDEEAISDFIEVVKTEDNFLHAGAITPCGPWCGRWWDVHPCGFACQITMRDTGNDL